MHRQLVQSINPVNGTKVAGSLGTIPSALRSDEEEEVLGRILWVVFRRCIIHPIREGEKWGFCDSTGGVIALPTSDGAFACVVIQYCYVPS